MRVLHRAAVWILASCAVLACGFALYAWIRPPLSTSLELVFVCFSGGVLGFVAYSMMRKALDGDDVFNEQGDLAAGQFELARYFALMLLGAVASAVTCVYSGSLRAVSLGFTALFALGAICWLLVLGQEKYLPAARVTRGR